MICEFDRERNAHTIRIFAMEYEHLARDFDFFAAITTK